ncbi:MAG: PQQ-binding-like beta-propeller repeat protein [bacterium]
MERLKLQWSKKLDRAEVFSSLITAYGYIFVCSKDGTVHILRQSNGKEVCTISLEEPHETIQTPAIFNKTLFVASSKSLKNTSIGGY